MIRDFIKRVFGASDDDDDNNQPIRTGSSIRFPTKRPPKDAPSALPAPSLRGPTVRERIEQRLDGDVSRVDIPLDYDTTKLTPPPLPPPLSSQGKAHRGDRLWRVDDVSNSPYIYTEPPTPADDVGAYHHNIKKGDTVYVTISGISDRKPMRVKNITKNGEADELELEEVR